MEIRLSYGRLISTVVFPILVRQHLYIESGPQTLTYSATVGRQGVLTPQTPEISRDVVGHSE